MWACTNEVVLIFTNVGGRFGLRSQDFDSTSRCTEWRAVFEVATTCVGRIFMVPPLLPLGLEDCLDVFHRRSLYWAAYQRAKHSPGRPRSAEDLPLCTCSCHTSFVGLTRWNCRQAYNVVEQLLLVQTGDSSSQALIGLEESAVHEFGHCTEWRSPTGY